jgi:hypothetical protein
MPVQEQEPHRQRAQTEVPGRAMQMVGSATTVG